MALRELIITHETPELQEAFIDFVPQVFPEISFRRWRDRGGWDERYLAFALAEENRIVASASRQEMLLMLNGQRTRGWQLSAVGTLPEYRRRGLQQQIMARLLAHTPEAEPMFLFANDSVLHFYPRFGFQRAREHKFQAPCVLQPSAAALRALDVADPADLALLLRIAARARPLSADFSACDHGRIILWYASNFAWLSLRHVPEHAALIAVAQDGELLHLLDVLSAQPFELRTVLPRLLTQPITRVELGFTPHGVWPGAEPAYEYTESPLFVRGALPLPRQPFKFPMLAQT